MNDLKYPIEVTPELVASFYKGERRSLSFSLLFKSKFAYVAYAFNNNEDLVTDAMTLAMERMVGVEVDSFTTLVAKVLINPSSNVLWHNRKHYETWSNRESMYVWEDGGEDSLTLRSKVIDQYELVDDQRNYIPLNNPNAIDVLERYLDRNYCTESTGSKRVLDPREMAEKMLRQAEGNRLSSKAELVGFTTGERSFIHRLAKRDEKGFRAAIKAAMETE